MPIEMMNDQAKEFHVRSGDAAIFGEDSDVRRNMTTPECIKRFDEVWGSRLSRSKFEV